MDGPAEPRDLADAASKASSNHDDDNSDSDQGSITRFRPHSRRQSRHHSRPQSCPQSPLPSPIALSDVESSAGSGQKYFTAGGAKAPSLESGLDKQELSSEVSKNQREDSTLQSKTTPSSGGAAQNATESHDSDCQITGTSRVKLIEADGTEPARQGNVDETFTTAVNVKLLPSASAPTPAKTKRETARERSSSPTKKKKAALGGVPAPITKGKSPVRASVYASVQSVRSGLVSRAKMPASVLIPGQISSAN